MPKNPFFVEGNQNEQMVVEDLIEEAFSIYGQDVYYIFRNIEKEDKILREDANSSYTDTKLLTVLLKSFDGYTGDGTFLSKFNLEIRDQIVLAISRRSMSAWPIERPREGDLIYFPMMNRLFSIMYVNENDIFYQLGKLMTWEVTCEMYEFSNEKFKTGVPEIDGIAEKYDFTIDEDFKTALKGVESNTALDEEIQNIKSGIGKFYDPFAGD